MNLTFMAMALRKIEIQQQSGDINPFTRELHRTLFDVLDFNPAWKVINITLLKKPTELCRVHI